MKVYVLIEHAEYYGSYGSHGYVLGAFANEDDANRALLELDIRGRVEELKLISTETELEKFMQ